MNTYRLDSNLSLVDLAPPIRGFTDFIGCYVLEGDQVALVDTGPAVSAGNLLDGLKALNIDLDRITYILTTHIHLDHAGGIGKAIKRMPNARVVVHQKGASHLVAPSRLWEDSLRALGQQAREYQPMEPVPEDRVMIARDGMSLGLGGMKIEVIHTPGHAVHHLSFLDRHERRLFAGEAAGVYVWEADMVRPATPPPFALEQALNSLDRLIEHHPVTLCYAHFGQTADAEGRLHHARRQLVSWGRIIADCVKREASHQEIYREIRARDNDDVLSRVDTLPPEQRDRELYFIDNSIKGFVGYFERYGPEHVNLAPPHPG